MSTRQKLQNIPYIPDKWEDVNCPVCKSNDYKIREKFGDKLQYTYVLCKKCKMVYLNPRPMYDEAFVFDAYEFYAEEDNRYNVSEDFYETQTDFERREIDEICKYDINRTSLLDVGCAAGKFLYRAKSFYKKVTGLEVSSLMATMVSNKLNIKVVTDKFEKAQFEEKFSCINISHVIEHYPYPGIWLDKAKSLLEIEGIVVISVPNMFSLDRRIKLIIKNIGLFKNTWEPWRTPDHLFEPTVSSMKFLFKKKGYKIVDFFSYSRKRNTDSTIFSRIYHRKFRLGSNLKFVVKPKK